MLEKRRKKKHNETNKTINSYLFNDKIVKQNSSYDCKKYIYNEIIYNPKFYISYN